MDIQNEGAYQKQSTIFQNKKTVLLGETGKEKLPRYCKNISLGFMTPEEIYRKCPFTGNVSIRGWILSGVVTKMKMQRTIVICGDYLHYIHKYNHFEKCHKNMSVHLSPCFRDVQISDIITTVCFNVLKVTKAVGTKKQFQEAGHLPTRHNEIKLFSYSHPTNHQKKKKKIVGVMWFIVVSVFTSLMASAIERLFIRLLAVFISSLVKCLLKYLEYFFNQAVFLYQVVRVIYIF
uniref:Small ribosomal subunit protein uS17 n=1 Tax=Cebus imitator TaxID=2715852 RepID=A0A2K5QNZ5_CEBIM